MKKFLLIAILIIGSLSGFAQTTNAPNSERIVQVSGTIIDADSIAVIPFVNVVNYRTRQGAISDLNGFFMFLMTEKDTIEFSAIGYEKQRFYLPKGLSNAFFNINIYLKKTVYDLSAVNFKFMDYERFRKEFEGIAIDKKDDKIVVGDPSIYKDYVTPKTNFGYTIKGPFSALYNKFSKKAREMEKLQDLLEDRNNNLEAAQKLTPGLIKQVTGLTDEDIEEFLTFCNLSVDFLATASQYDIIIAISKCYEQFVITFPEIRPIVSDSIR